jgi:hypothetical protein
MVVGPSSIEVVRLVGGWLCDQSLAGWDVTVYAGHDADPRSLRILGVNSAELEPALAGPLPRPAPHIVAVHADLYRCDLRARRIATDAREGSTSVVLWGNSWLGEAEQWPGPSRHRPSAAACAFKARALAASRLPNEAMTPVETFGWTDQLGQPQHHRDGERRSFGPVGATVGSADSSLIREST